MGTATGLAEGLTVGLLVLFGVYGVLGFLMFAVLYAAAGSLISRQEDVNAVVMPMTLVSTAGYMVGTYAALGLLDIRSGLITGLAQVPLLSPFMMLGRIATGVAAPWEIVLSVVLFVVFIGLRCGWRRGSMPPESCCTASVRASGPSCTWSAKGCRSPGPRRATCH